MSRTSRCIDRHEEEGLSGLADKRLEQVSHRRAPVDEVLRVETLYRERYDGWNVMHFHSHYRRHHAGQFSHSWVKNTLQHTGLVTMAAARGKHRKCREPAAMPGMMVHQDGSTHEWVPVMGAGNGCREWVPGCWWNLIVTMDDATNEHYSMFFVAKRALHPVSGGV